MPALYTHLRFGKEVTQSLPPAYQAFLEKYPEAFALGTQGPDILFYHKPMKKNEIRAFGTTLHTYSGERFFLEQGKKLRLRENASTQKLLEENGAFAAYLCGFLCHFTLDTICHPFIDENSSENITHGKIESELDKFWLRKDGKPIRGYNTATPILDKNGTREAVAHSLGVTEESVARSIKTMRKINKLFSRKGELFHAFAHFILKIAGMERKFGDMFLHKKDDPLFAPLCPVLEEKYLSAIPQAAALVQAYFKNIGAWVENGKTDQELFRYDFSGIITKETI